jgi:transcriptional regulator with XRE-family HTH domain
MKYETNLPNLALLRELKGMTRRQLGDALGFTERSVGRWENGESEPVLSDLRKIAAYFDVTVAYLIGEVNQSGQPFPRLSRD